MYGFITFFKRFFGGSSKNVFSPSRNSIEINVEEILAKVNRKDPNVLREIVYTRIKEIESRTKTKKRKSTSTSSTSKTTKK